MKNDELSLLEELNKCSQLHFLKGEQAAALSCWQEARAIQIVHHTGDFSILEDTVQMHEQELINMAQFFYDNEKEDWGGILANMVGLFRAISISGPMSDRIKTQKNRENAQGSRGGARFLDSIWNDAIEEELSRFASEGVNYTHGMIYLAVESKLSDRGIECPSESRVKKKVSKICKRLGISTPKLGAPRKSHEKSDIDKVKAVILKDPTLAAKKISDELDNKLSKEKVDSILSYLKLRNTEDRRKFKENMQKSALKPLI
ncbi:hypothetical protein R7042_23855 [Vibrio sp. 1262-1]|nr:hypothetical protein [Vibrio sp. 1262-1]MDW2405223.1 hypothetical protein [Vibrio sp. 1262-1]